MTAEEVIMLRNDSSRCPSDKKVKGGKNDNRNRSAQCGFRVSGPIDKPNGLPGEGREIERKCGHLLV